MVGSFLHEVSYSRIPFLKLAYAHEVRSSERRKIIESYMERSVFLHT